MVCEVKLLNSRLDTEKLSTKMTVANFTFTVTVFMRKTNSYHCWITSSTDIPDI